ncbi:hypothetical protein ACHAWF_014754, partial [Thalassiosira exigua]
FFALSTRLPSAVGSGSDILRSRPIPAHSPFPRPRGTKPREKTKMASIARLMNAIPVPIFGSLGTAGKLTFAKARALPRMAGWVLPLSVGALWFVWPAVDDGWKVEVGIAADPEAAAKAAEEQAAAAAAPKAELSEAAAAKVEGAYKAHEHVETEDDKLLAKAAASGDYSQFEEKWEAFTVKATNPGDDDDDDDEDEDDEDEEEDDDDEDDD